MGWDGLPLDWRVMTAAAIHKEGPHKLLGNCRPAGFKCIPRKRFERRVGERVSDYLTKCRFLCKRLRRFTRRRLWLSNPPGLLYEATVELHEQKVADVCYLDSSGAVDLLNHGLLNTKIQSFGIQS